MPNINEEQIKVYLHTFLNEYERLACQYIPQSEYKKLLRINLLPSKINAYVSTQFGVGFVYKKALQTTIETTHGSKRVEDMIIDIPKRATELSPMLKIGGDSTISSMTLEASFPLQLVSRGAKVTLVDVMFKAGNWKKEIEYAEIYGERKADYWTVSEAKSRARMEILSAVADIQISQKRGLNIDQYIDNSKSKNVLVLGQYSATGSSRLSEIVRVLNEKGYNPMIVKDFPDNPYQNLKQKVVTFGCLAKFVIIEDSEPGGQIMEVELSNGNQWITLILRGEGTGSSYMTTGYSATSSIINESTYGENNFTDVLNSGLEWAEETLKRIKGQFENTYPWRKA